MVVHDYAHEWATFHFVLQSFFSPLSDVDDVHEMMDDIQEQTELADEISRAISEPAGFGMDVDEVSIQNVNATFHNEFVATLMLSFFNTQEIFLPYQNWS